MSAGKLVRGQFLRRPHRFAVEATLEDGRAVVAHLGDPGRLRELLLPGAELRLRVAPPHSARKTRYTVCLVRALDGDRPWVSLETGRANRLAERLLSEGRVHGVPRRGSLRREVACGDSRFDFRLEPPPPSPPFWIEVKSVTCVEDGAARFPDAPTERGRRHLEGLVRLARAGERALVLFVVQRGDARIVRAYRAIDPAFAEWLERARDSGVRLRAVAFRFDSTGRARPLGPLPVRP